MDDLGPILRLIPALLVILFLLAKRKKKKTTTEGPAPRRVRRAKRDEPKFERDYEPIEPS